MTSKHGRLLLRIVIKLSTTLRQCHHQSHFPSPLSIEWYRGADMDGITTFGIEKEKEKHETFSPSFSRGAINYIQDDFDSSKSHHC